jgi:UDPglucose 6-dehydrogenase
MGLRIAIAGLGYVGISNGLVLARNNTVVGYDVQDSKVNLINSRVSPIDDPEVANYLKNKELNFTATSDKRKAFSGADFVIVATPTNYDPSTNMFDTSSIHSVVEDVLSINPDAVVVIKSTVPIGFTKGINLKYLTDNIIFSPEFLREGQALTDNLYPSRIVVGEKSGRARTFAGLLVQGAIKKDIPVLYTGSVEAEAIKLFANTYLAMRVAYFNEVDTYSEYHKLNSADIIAGVSLDPRVGDYYNNPSFGYGGYCLPKDTKQLLFNFNGVPQNLIQAIVHSNQTRIDHIVKSILNQGPKVVGVYRLLMKSGSDNIREASVIKVLEKLGTKGVKILIYEPKASAESLSAIGLSSLIELVSLDAIKAESDVIIANRLAEELSDVSEKVFSRDLNRSN